MSSTSFSSLRTKPSSQSHSTGGALSRTFVTTFDSTLYSTYLLGLLNQDKIFRMDSFLIKVDIDNGFCSFIDEKRHRNGYNDLKNNNFSNPNIFSFVHEDEPALVVLQEIRAGRITWEGYQTELARKVNNFGGLCIKRGAEKDFASKSVQNLATDNPPAIVLVGGTVTSTARYVKNFLHFALEGTAVITRTTFGGVGPIICTSSIRTNSIFEYEGACKGYVNSNIWNDNTINPCNRVTTIIYSAGTALKTRKLKVDVYARVGAYSNNLALYGNSFSLGGQSVKIGF
jgi:hypothetical protein